MNCNKCNTINNEEAKFCKNCGSPLNSLTRSLKIDQRDFRLISIVFIAQIIQSVMNIAFNIIRKNIPFHIENNLLFARSLGIINIIIVLIIATAINNKNLKVVLYLYAAISFIVMAYYYVNFG